MGDRAQRSGGAPRCERIKPPVSNRKALFTMNAKLLLARARVARLATVSNSGAPHIVPIVFAYDGKHIYSALDEKRKRVAPMRLERVRNILANPSVSLLMDQYEEDWSKLAWVRVDGRARILQRGTAHARGIACLRDKYPQYRAMKLEERPIIQIKIKRIVAWQAQAQN